MGNKMLIHIESVQLMYLLSTYGRMPAYSLYCVIRSCFVICLVNLVY